MSLRYLAIPAALLVASPAVLAAQGDESQASTKEQAADEAGQEDPALDKIVCRRIKTTGSRVNSTRECKSKRQWIAQRAQSRQEIEKIQSSRWKSE